ncbi:MAG: YgiT-type zinc finger protein [Candidatus Sumerlaeaceae bacterium]|nr:YgiT-type zinc finger protein [Candidatus Sumerlaeaceae bacterium]
MKCIHCQGEMERGLTPVHLDRAGCHITLDGIPAWVCSQCGEPYFEESEVAKLQELIRSVESQAQALAESA